MGVQKIEARVTALAAAQGISVEEYIQNFLEGLAAIDEGLSYDSMPPEQWIRELEEWLDGHDYITARPFRTKRSVLRASTVNEKIASYELSGRYSGRAKKPSDPCDKCRVTLGLLGLVDAHRAFGERNITDMEYLPRGLSWEL